MSFGGSRLLRYACAITFAAAMVLAAAGLTGTGLPLGGKTGVAFAIVLAGTAFALLWGPPRLLSIALPAYLVSAQFDGAWASGSGTATVAKLAGLALAVALFLRILRTGRIADPSRALVLWFVFTLWVFASIARTSDLTQGFNDLATLLSVFALYALLALTPIDERDLTNALTWFSLGGVIAAVVELEAFRHGVDTGGKLGRAYLGDTAHHVDPNFTAAAFIVPLALLTVAALRATGILLKIACAAGALTIVSAILATGSRAGLLSCGVALCYLIIRSRFRLQLAMLLPAALALLFVYPTVWLRIFYDPQEAQAGGRFLIWRVAFIAFRDQWLFGHGVGSFRTAYASSVIEAFQPPKFFYQSMEAHNIVVLAAVELGIVGTILLLAAWWAQLRSLVAIGRDEPMYDLRIALETGAVALFTESMSLHLMGTKAPWVLFALMAMTRTVWLRTSVAAPRLDPVPSSPVIVRAAARPPRRMLASEAT